MNIQHDWYHTIPEHMRPGMISYVHQGILPGGFLQAVMRNDLFDAVGRADSTNQCLLHVYVSVMSNCFPKASIGSRDAMTKWCDDRRESPLPVGSVDWPDAWCGLAERMMAGDPVDESD